MTRKFLTAYLFIFTVFLSGAVFGAGFGRGYYKAAIVTAYEYGYSQGGESVILASLER